MTEYWIVYRDITGFPRQQFERIDPPKPGELLVRDQVFPGAYGYPTMYIRKHHVHLADQIIMNLITYTEREPNAEELPELALRALQATAKTEGKS
jgi:hypothetical protein